MTWGKVSDELHDDEKWRAASKGARALWVTALSWSASKGNGGRVPRHMLTYLDGTAKEAASLVEVGLWDRDGDGFRFHDWDDYNEPEEAASARKARRAVAGVEANHRRWHVARGVVSDTCPMCSESDRSTDGLADGVTESDMNPPVPGPVPVRTDYHLSESSPVVTARETTDPIEVSEMSRTLAGQQGITSVEAVADAVWKHTRRRIDGSGVYRLVLHLLGKAKTHPRVPQRYVLGAISRSPGEVQQFIDEQAMAVRA